MSLGLKMFCKLANTLNERLKIIHLLFSFVFITLSAVDIAKASAAFKDQFKSVDKIRFLVDCGHSYSFFVFRSICVHFTTN